MYEFHYTLTLEEWKTRTELRLGSKNASFSLEKRRLRISGAIYSGGFLIVVGWWLAVRAMEVYGWPGFFIELFMEVGFVLLLFRKIRNVLVFAITKWKLKKCNEDQSLHLIITDTQVTLETEAGKQYFSWSIFQFINRFENLVVLWGKKKTIYIPVREIGAEEEIQDLLRYARECMDRERHGAIDVKLWWKKYEKISTYCYYFNITQEEAAEEYVQVVPRPLISKGYWTRLRCFKWVAALFITAFYCGLMRSPIVWGIVACLYLLIIGRSIWYGRYETRKNSLLKGRNVWKILPLTGECMMAFNEDGVTIVKTTIISEYSWRQLMQIKEHSTFLAFVLHTGYTILLPTKVFESPAEKQQLIEYCNRKIKQK